jgi:hypothetical protein
MNKKPINTGGPAFPVKFRNYTLEGMTLRDWFAGQAIISHPLRFKHYEQAALESYELADAMLREREEVRGE